MASLRKNVFTTRTGSVLAIHESDGAGPALFGIGGLSVRPISISALYEAFKAMAAAGTRCVLMEIAGGGESPSRSGLTMDMWLADVEEVFETHVRERAIWTGTSIGAWLMMLAHRRHPERFHAMCAIAPAFDWDQQYIGPGIRDGKLGVADGVVVDGGGSTVAARDVLVSMAPHHVMNAPFQLHAPLHVIFGGRDEVAPPEATRQFIERANGAPATGQLFPDADHSIAKLEWEYAPGQYLEWARRQVGALR